VETRRGDGRFERDVIERDGAGALQHFSEPHTGKSAVGELHASSGRPDQAREFT